MLPVKGEADIWLLLWLFAGQICLAGCARFLLLISTVVVPFLLWIGCTPNHRQLECCAHCTPPFAAAAAHILPIGLRDGRPRNLRVSGDGKSFNLSSHSWQ